jgi:serine/threonine protein kinase
MSLQLPGVPDDAANVSPYSPPPNTRVLASILSDIGASEFLQNFIDDEQDDDCFITYKNPERISKRYGLPPNLASIFVERSRARAVAASDLSSFSSALPSMSSIPSQSAATAAPALDDASLLLKLNLEFVCELGKGGFGKVYKCKDAAQKRVVAVKLVNDPINAQASIREGQKLLRALHKNIVRVHRVHDLNPILGNGTCALEMEVIEGGDLFQHLEAARRRPEQRLPRPAVLRLSRQLLETLAYLHDEMKWLHGDIKPQNMLMQCSHVPADDSAVDYSSAEIKLADFGLAKVMDQHDSTASFMLSNASTHAGVIKGTAWYLSPEALKASSGVYERSCADDLWSACLVIFEMDTGLPLQQLMTLPGAVKLDELLAKASPELMPLLCSVLAMPDAASRCQSAAELLQKLDASIDPLFVWQRYDITANKYVSVHPASSFALEEAFAAQKPFTMLPLQPPFDLIFDIKALLSSSTALGYETSRSSGVKSAIRRLLKPSVLTSSCEIPVWLQLMDGKEWQQCSPSLCAKLDIDSKNPNSGFDKASFKRLTIDSSSISSIQLPHPMKSEPYLAPAHADDIAMLTRRVHDSLPDWDITGMQQVVNTALASKYASYRHRVAARCNGNPNERIMFHFARPPVMTKIWQEGEGHDPRLSNWAEVGKGAYFSKHVIYCYAYNYSLWPSPPGFAVKPEPPIGASMQVFATLVCLGNTADMGPGCETCPSPAWDAWKKELPVLPKPTRPPAITLPADAAEKQNILDLMQVKDVPRYDSVMSTEGDFGTHSASTGKDASGRRICDAMHPRLKDRAKEWAEQCILFDPAASYPMFIVTLTKTRDSPMGAQQLINAGCDVNRIKALGFTASHVKALGRTAQEMRRAGWLVIDLKDAGFDAGSLLTGGCSAPELKREGFTAQQLKTGGCSAQQLKDAGFSAVELAAAAFDVPSLLSGGFSASELKSEGFTAQQLKTGGCNAQQLKDVGFSAVELAAAAFDVPSLLSGGFSASELKSEGFTAQQLKTGGCNAQQLKDVGFSAVELAAAAFDVPSLLSGGFSASELKREGFTAQQLKTGGCNAQQLKDAGFTAKELKGAGFSLTALDAANFLIEELKSAGFDEAEILQAS